MALELGPGSVDLPPVWPPPGLAVPVEKVDPGAVEDMFTLGYCHVLAHALHARTGWPVVVAGDGPGGVVGWVHVAVRRPDGSILDVQGVHDPDAWIDRWGQWADAYGLDCLDQDDNLAYDSDAVGIYDWDASLDELLRHEKEPPTLVLRTADATADDLLARFGAQA